MQGGDPRSLNARDTCALPEGEERRARAGVLPKCWDNPDPTAGGAEPGTSGVQRLRGSWSLAEAPVVDKKARRRERPDEFLGQSLPSLPCLERVEQPGAAGSVDPRGPGPVGDLEGQVSSHWQ